MATDIQLVRPHRRYRESFLEGLRQFQAEGLPWHREIDFAQVSDDFEGFVLAELERAQLRTAERVPETVYWAIVPDGRYVGRISIRHELNDALRIFGGNIGYDTVPEFRRQGIASRMLAETLPRARELGLSEVLLTCDDTNAASIRVIEKNGGVLLERRAIDPAKPPKRYYWIAL